MAGQKSVLLWDGECALCRKCVEWVEGREMSGTLFPVAYQEVPSPPMTPALRAECRRAIQLLTPGRGSVSGGKAVLSLLFLLGWKKSAALLGLPPFSLAVEAAYRLIALNRPLIARLLSRD